MESITLVAKQANIAVFDIGSEPEVAVGNKIAILRTTKAGETYWQAFETGSVANSIAANPSPYETADERMARAVARGEAMYWANPMPAILTGGRNQGIRKPAIKAEIGGRIRMDGRIFRVEATWNNNLRLVEVTE